MPGDNSFFFSNWDHGKGFKHSQVKIEFRRFIPHFDASVKILVTSKFPTEKPDNHLGHQEYAIMLNTSGKWQDVKRSTWKRAAVCKNYSVVCPSVDEFYEGYFPGSLCIFKL